MEEAAKIACMWYAVDAYSRLTGLTHEEIQQTADRASELSQENPLWHHHKKEFTLPHIPGELTGLQVMAYLAAGTDVLSGHQITDNGMTRFNEWLMPARRLAGMQDKRQASHAHLHDGAAPTRPATVPKRTNATGKEQT